MHGAWSPPRREEDWKTGGGIIRSTWPPGGWRSVGASPAGQQAGQPATPQLDRRRGQHAYGCANRIDRYEPRRRPPPTTNRIANAETRAGPTCHGHGGASALRSSVVGRQMKPGTARHGTPSQLLLLLHAKHTAAPNSLGSSSSSSRPALLFLLLAVPTLEKTAAGQPGHPKNVRFVEASVGDTTVRLSFDSRRFRRAVSPVPGCLFSPRPEEETSRLFLVSALTGSCA